MDTNELVKYVTDKRRTNIDIHDAIFAFAKDRQSTTILKVLHEMNFDTEKFSRESNLKIIISDVLNQYLKKAKLDLSKYSAVEFLRWYQQDIKVEYYGEGSYRYKGEVVTIDGLFDIFKNLQG